MGSIFNINKNDWHVPAYRELAGLLWRGWPLEHILLYWNGFEEGASPPEGVNDLPVCVPIASQLLHAAGIGMAMNIEDRADGGKKKEKKVVMTYFGDGASSEGDCHEALNFAAVFNAPVVFMCLNNQYAISVPLSKQMKNETIAQRAVAYGMPGIKVDGNDVLAVYQATKEAVERARRGEGPSLIECLTYRVTPHTTADDPKRYRSEDETKEWMLRDSLPRFAKYLESKGVLSEKERNALEEEVDAQIKAAVQNAEEMFKSEALLNPLNMFDNLFEDVPPYLQEQKDELRDHFKTKGKDWSNPQKQAQTPAASRK
jgi:pyruvate dehydrogenase E1 component alpha subunit